MTSKPYRSLALLRKRHRELLKQRRNDGDTSAFRTAVAEFIHRGRATGVLLNSENDRWEAQNLLDYWANELHHVRHEVPEATLSEYDSTLAPELDDALCPYLGLDAFEIGDHALFFGRETLVKNMVAKLADGRFLAIIGASGSGKSSIALAGILPQLQAGALPGSQSWHTYPRLVPGSNPLQNLARLVRPAHVPAGWVADTIAKFQQSPTHLAHLINEATNGETAVLVVDQFEEMFTLCSDESLRIPFIQNLRHLITSETVPHRLILTMRTDYESRLVSLAEMQAHYAHSHIRVTPMNAAELRAVIEKPAAHVGLTFEDDLVEQLVSDVLGEPAALPLLQFTLLKLWEKRNRNQITWAAYSELGSGRQALANSADAVYQTLTPEDQLVVRRILLRIVQPSQGLEVLRNRTSRTVLYQMGETQERVDHVLDQLITARLVRLTAGETPADDQVEIGHETLVHNWPRLVDWLEEERVTLRRRLRLTAMAEQWEALQRDPSALLRGRLLQDALRYDDLNPLEATFVETSTAVEAQEKMDELARARRLTRRLAAFTIILTVVFMMTVITGVTARQHAEAARDKARLATARELAAVAVAKLDSSPQLSLLLALESIHTTTAHDQTPPSEATDALYRAVQASQQLLTLSGHTDWISGVAFNPDGSLIATASFDASVRLWDAGTGQSLNTLTGHTGLINDLAFSPDGHHLAAAGEDGLILAWDVETGSLVRTLEAENDGPVRAIAFHPDGVRLAAAYESGTIRIWQSQSPLLSRVDHDGPVSDIAFNPDGSRFASAGVDGRLIVYETETGTPVYTIEAEFNANKEPIAIYALAFSPDGSRLATAHANSVIKIWDGSELVQLLSGYTGSISDVAYNQAGDRLVSASSDGTAKVWQVASGQLIFTLAGHHGPVTAVAFDPTGNFIATASQDRTAQIYPVLSIEELVQLAWEQLARPLSMSECAQYLHGEPCLTTNIDGTAPAIDP